MKSLFHQSKAEIVLGRLVNVIGSIALIAGFLAVSWGMLVIFYGYYAADQDKQQAALDWQQVEQMKKEVKIHAMVN